MAYDWPLGIIVGRQITNALVWVPFTVLTAQVTWWAADVLRAPARWATYAVAGVLLVSVINVIQGSFVVLIGPPLWTEPDAMAALREGAAQSGLMGLVWYALLVVGALAFDARRSRRPTPETDYLNTLEIRERGAVHRVSADEVEWIEAAGDYARVRTAQREYLLQRRMNALESELDPRFFARVHRSAIVNLREVGSYSAARHGDVDLTLRSGNTVRLTRTRRKKVMARMKELGGGATGSGA